MRPGLTIEETRMRRSVALVVLLAASVSAQQPSTHPMRINYDVKVRARDGVHLSADIFRPMDDAKHPVVFNLTPYNNDSDNTMEQAWSYVSRGYAYVTADVRGRYDSEGSFDPYRNDGKDGSDIM